MSMNRRLSVVLVILFLTPVLVSSLDNEGIIQLDVEEDGQQYISKASSSQLLPEDMSTSYKFGVLVLPTPRKALAAATQKSICNRDVRMNGCRMQRTGQLNAHRHGRPRRPLRRPQRRRRRRSSSRCHGPRGGHDRRRPKITAPTTAAQDAEPRVLLRRDDHPDLRRYCRGRRGRGHLRALEQFKSDRQNSVRGARRRRVLGGTYLAARHRLRRSGRREKDAGDD